MEGLPRLSALGRVSFHPVSSVGDFRRGGSVSFCPLFCHHFFAAEEKIIGFEKVQVRLFFTPTTFQVYVHLSGQVSSKAANPTKVRSKLLQQLTQQVPFPGRVCKTPAEFEQRIRE
ncbi:hypothetical protein ETH_00036360, partial [Eimeria tenella]